MLQARYVPDLVMFDSAWVNTRPSADAIMNSAETCAFIEKAEYASEAESTRRKLITPDPSFGPLHRWWLGATSNAFRGGFDPAML